MKKWIPLTISFCIHGVIFYVIAYNGVPNSTSEKQLKPKVINAVLFFPPVEPAKAEVSLESEIAPEEPQIVPDEPIEEPLIAPTQTKEPVLAVEKKEIIKEVPVVEPIVSTGPKEELKEEVSEDAGEQPNEPNQPGKPNPVRTNTTDIRRATRKALRSFNSDSLQELIDSKQQEYENKDSRIIVDAPRKSLEEIYEEKENAPPPVEVDCSDVSKKVLEITAGALGGRVKCRSQSSDQINQFINKHINKTTVQPLLNDEKNQSKN